MCRILSPPTAAARQGAGGARRLRPAGLAGLAGLDSLLS